MRLALAVLVAALALPAGATAKGGVIFDRYPDVQAVGAPMTFTVMLFSARAEGVRPLVTFRDCCGRVARVRTSPADLNGIAYGTVRLPAPGPWKTEIAIGGRPYMHGDAEPFRVGVGLTRTTVHADPPPPRPELGGGGVDPRAWIAAALTAALGMLGIARWRAA